MPKIRDSIIVDPKHKGKASFFDFTLFITPLLIKLFYIAGSISIICGSIFMWYKQYCTADCMPIELPWYSHLIWVFATICLLVALRVFCELQIVWFKMFEELRSK